MVVLGLFAVWCSQILPLAREAPWLARRSPITRCAAPGREIPSGRHCKWDPESASAEQSKHRHGLSKDTQRFALNRSELFTLVVTTRPRPHGFRGRI